MRQQTGTRRTFTGATLPEALLLMKREMGEDALFVSKQRVRKGGLFGLGAQEVWEVTGEHLPDFLRRRPTSPRPAPAPVFGPPTISPRDPVPDGRLKLGRQEANELISALVKVHRQKLGRPGVEPLPDSAADIIERAIPGAGYRNGAYGAARGGAARGVSSRSRGVERDPRFSAEHVVPRRPAPEPVDDRGSRDGEPGPFAHPSGSQRAGAWNAGPPDASAVTRPADPEMARMRSDMDQLRQMMSLMLGQMQGANQPALVAPHTAPLMQVSAPATAGPAPALAAAEPPATAPPVSLSAPFTAWCARLESAGVDPSLAADLVARVAARTPLDEADDASLVRSRLAKEIGGSMRIATCPEPGPDRPLVVVVIGATGVGKTTTLAKLGAIFHRSEGRSIAFITLDDFRIAAAEQLRTYSDLLQAPFEAVSTPEQLGAALDRFYDQEVILIDTTGRSPYDTPALAQLREMLQSLHIEPEVLLLISASTQVAEMEAVLKSFSFAERLSLCFTKVDETVRWGPIYSLAVRSGLPVAYCTTGQDVPEDIEPALRDTFVKALLGPEPGAGSERLGDPRERAR